MTDVSSPGSMPRSAIYVRDAFTPPSPPPGLSVGPAAWVRQNLFATPLNSAITILTALFLAWAIPPLLDWLFFNAVWSGANREACLPVDGEARGACWAFIKAKFGQFIYGRYPLDERWRVDLTGLLFAIGLVLLAVPKIPGKGITAYVMLVIFPTVAFFLLYGSPSLQATDVAWAALILGGGAALIAWPAFPLKGPVKVVLAIAGPVIVIRAFFGLIGLPEVETALWGGLLVTLVVAVTGIVASLPLGILLALGRRSKLPIVKVASVVFIEFWRGVPLITVLFMASVMLPLFLPTGVTFDKLLRALIGVALFSAAYMAETVRGGLQAIPKGQREAADSLGLGYWQGMRLVILPQALKIVIPGIVNSFIALFKDTSLVLIIGLFDVLGIAQLNFQDANWAAPSVPATGFVFVALVFWIFCFSMSRYSQYMERRLDTGHRK